MPLRLTLPALLVALLVALGAMPAQADEPATPWAGEWRTSFSTLKVEQDGDHVTGTYGNQDQFHIEGQVKGDTCSFTYTEGRVSGKGEWVMQKGAASFKGKLLLENGRPRDWNGWRPDPQALQGEGRYAGTWLTSLGLLQLQQTEKKVV